MKTRQKGEIRGVLNDGYRERCESLEEQLQAEKYEVKRLTELIWKAEKHLKEAANTLSTDKQDLECLRAYEIVRSAFKGRVYNGQAYFHCEKHPECGCGECDCVDGLDVRLAPCPKCSKTK